MSDHKVVILLRHSTPDYGGQFVYFSSLRNKGWQHVPFPYNYMTSRDGVNFNNTLHWIVSDVENSDWDPDYYDSDYQYYEYYRKWDNLAGCNKIVYFDPVDDAFKTLPSPTRINSEEEDSIVGTGIIDGCFCMARKDENRQVIRVSLMKDYGIQESWVTSFAISMMRFKPFHIYNLKFMSQNGKYL
ncbi:unnamed protein product [Cuscuta epithymum]|uniref:F-box associated domain-containing protein n=1 Tax=Cuscuta epithymum TaxID=186058 RepID=A0AAV0FNM4_9ASTE|nr:unnamed protein product [Cuscuta epithymum]